MAHERLTRTAESETYTWQVSVDTQKVGRNVSRAHSGNPGLETLEMTSVQQPDGLVTPTGVVEEEDSADGCGDVHRGTPNVSHNSVSCNACVHTLEYLAGSVEYRVDWSYEPTLTVCVATGSCYSKATSPGLCLLNPPVRNVLAKQPHNSGAEAEENLESDSPELHKSYVDDVWTLEAAVDTEWESGDGNMWLQASLQSVQHESISSDRTEVYKGSREHAVSLGKRRFVPQIQPQPALRHANSWSIGQGPFALREADSHGVTSEHTGQRASDDTAMPSDTNNMAIDVTHNEDTQGKPDHCYEEIPTGPYRGNIRLVKSALYWTNHQWTTVCSSLAEAMNGISDGDTALGDTMPHCSQSMVDDQSWVHTVQGEASLAVMCLPGSTGAPVTLETDCPHCYASAQGNPLYYGVAMPGYYGSVSHEAPKSTGADLMETGHNQLVGACHLMENFPQYWRAEAMDTHHTGADSGILVPKSSPTCGDGITENEASWEHLTLPFYFGRLEQWLEDRRDVAREGSGESMDGPDKLWAVGTSPGGQTYGSATSDENDEATCFVTSRNDGCMVVQMDHSNQATGMDKSLVHIGNTVPVGPIVLKTSRAWENELENPVWTCKTTSLKDHTVHWSSGAYSRDHLDVLGTSSSDAQYKRRLEETTWTRGTMCDTSLWSPESHEAIGMSWLESVECPGPLKDRWTAVGVGDNVVVVAGIGMAGDGERNTLSGMSGITPTLSCVPCADVYNVSYVPVYVDGYHYSTGRTSSVVLRNQRRTDGTTGILDHVGEQEFTIVSGDNYAHPPLHSTGECLLYNDLNVWGTPSGTITDIMCVDTMQVASEGAVPGTCDLPEAVWLSGSWTECMKTRGGGVKSLSRWQTTVDASNTFADTPVLEEGFGSGGVTSVVAVRGEHVLAEEVVWWTACAADMAELDLEIVVKHEE